MDAELESFESFLNEVKKYITPAKEKTIFALGGRSYYEKPASDLLKFFLNPDAEHGLGDVFLTTFIECIREAHHQLDISGVDIQREVQTANGNYIDLQILGRDWCLIIENKIYHIQSNPFKDYEAHAAALKKNTTFFAILSPDGHSEADGWRGVSYKQYCLALRGKMAALYFDAPFSKWQIFAREFILHMENELYNSLMISEQAKLFVEQNADQIDRVKKLEAQYIEFISAELKQQLEARVTGHTFNVRPEWWVGYGQVFRCSEPQWRGSSILLLIRGFQVRAYLRFEDVSEPQQTSVMEALKYKLLGREKSAQTWESIAGVAYRKDAIAELCECAKSVNDLIK